MTRRVEVTERTLRALWGYCLPDTGRIVIARGISERDRLGTHYGVENGCLCGLQPSYIKHPDWQQGFTQIDLAAGVVSVRQHHIQGGRLLVDGNLYTA